MIKFVADIKKVLIALIREKKLKAQKQKRWNMIMEIHNMF